MPSEVHSLPVKIGRADYIGYDRQEVTGLRGRRCAVLARAPRLTQSKMVRAAASAYEEVRRVPEADWWAIFRRAGELFMSADLPIGDRRVSYAEHVESVSQISGLPIARVRTALEALVADFARFEELSAIQRAGMHAECFATGRTGQPFTLTPNGQHLAVRVPANSPAINITWLLALALRRPILLGVSVEEPFTPLRVVEALYAGGLPHGAVSLVYDERAPIFEMADQVLWAGDAPASLAAQPRRVKTYHQGRSKAVLVGEGSEQLWQTFATMARRGSGRLCTNLSGLLVVGDARQVGCNVAKALSEIPILPLDHGEAILAAMTDQALVAAIEREIQSAIARGADDLTGKVSALPRVVESDGLTFLRPTVLLIDVKDRFFGAELPFPFITVAEATREQVARHCRGSLVVSMVGADEELIRRAAREPGVDKIFMGEYLDRGYDSRDPHEGYLAEFLYSKKALWPSPERI